MPPRINSEAKLPINATTVTFQELTTVFENLRISLVLDQTVRKRSDRQGLTRFSAGKTPFLRQDPDHRNLGLNLTKQVGGRLRVNGYNFSTFCSLTLDPLHFTIAVAPLAVYLLLVGCINLFSAPFMTTGARDFSALAIALCGFIMVGPMELFHPEAAAGRFHGWVWVLLLIFYALSVSLMILLMRPRLVIYNMTSEQLMPVLRNLTGRLDKDARWAGESVALPALGIQFYIQEFAPLRNVQLIANGTKQSFEAWRILEKELADDLKPVRSSRGSYGYLLIVTSGIVAAIAVTAMLRDQPGVLQALNEMLRQ
jgi:hypothetical protein